MHYILSWWTLCFSWSDEGLVLSLTSVLTTVVWIFCLYIPCLKPNCLQLCGSTHKGQRNANHSLLGHICLSFLLIAREDRGVIPRCMKVRAEDTHWASWSDGCRGWCRVQSDGSSGWSSAHSHGMKGVTVGFRTDCEDWQEGKESLFLEWTSHSLAPQGGEMMAPYELHNLPPHDNI